MHAILMAFVLSLFVIGEVFSLATPAFASDTTCPVPQNVLEYPSMHVTSTLSKPTIDAQKHPHTEVATFGLG
ncbi:hypothetical protein DQK91_13445 [Oceanidesulfovibrio marinus]|uniref:Uncharacterized protein n=1 Tax=Oceanidesulfovibrio marinus TaxID=370038 RepID=A0A6P1ZEX6_9BACT|nr:hypothetical protein DQK91_13445 [Oceanidesulfovibrio marinus]